MEQSHFMMSSTMCTLNIDENIRHCFLLFYLQPGQTIFLLENSQLLCRCYLRAQEQFSAYYLCGTRIATVCGGSGDHSSSPIPKPECKKPSFWDWRQYFVQLEDLEDKDVVEEKERAAKILPSARLICFFPVGILVITQIFYSTLIAAGQKAEYSIKNSSLPPFLYLLSLASGSIHAVLAGLFLCPCWHFCIWPRCSLSMCNYTEVFTEKAFCVGRKLVNRGGCACACSKSAMHFSQANNPAS